MGEDGGSASIVDVSTLVGEGDENDVRVELSDAGITGAVTDDFFVLDLVRDAAVSHGRRSQAEVFTFG